MGFLTPLACLGSLLLLFTYVMSGTASVCAFYALFAIVILTMWRTSSWIGVDGLISGYRQRHVEPKLVRRDEIDAVAVPRRNTVVVPDVDLVTVPLAETTPDPVQV
jgi:hypothetical protein